MNDNIYNTEMIEKFVSDFESIKEYDYTGKEIWRASKLMPLLGYTKWQKFNDCIARSMNNFNGIIMDLCRENNINSLPARVSCSGNLFNINENYIPIEREIVVNNGAIRKYPDYILTILACYAIAMEADNRKPEVKLAKQYMIVSLAEYRNIGRYIENNQRIGFRDEAKMYENQLESTYASHGVPSSKFGVVKSSGDAGFYGNPGGTRAVKAELGIPNNAPLMDYAPFEVMLNKSMANYKTKYGIINKDLHGTNECASEAYTQNERQREDMLCTTGMYPEEMMPVDRINTVRKDINQINKNALQNALEGGLSVNIDPRIYSLKFNYNGYDYDLNTWCYMNNINPQFVLDLLDQGIPFEEAIFTRPNNTISPIIFF